MNLSLIQLQLLLPSPSKEVLGLFLEGTYKNTLSTQTPANRLGLAASQAVLLLGEPGLPGHLPAAPKEPFLGAFPQRHAWFFVQNSVVIKMTARSRKVKTSPAASTVHRKQLGRGCWNGFP